MCLPKDTYHDNRGNHKDTRISSRACSSNRDDLGCLIRVGKHTATIRRLTKMTIFSMLCRHLIFMMSLCDTSIVMCQTAATSKTHGDEARYGDECYLSCPT